MNHNVFRLARNGNGLTITRMKQRQRCLANVSAPAYAQPNTSKFCPSCRTLLRAAAPQGLAILDLYDMDNHKVYPVKIGASYTIRDYTVTVTREDQSYRIEASAHLF